MNTVVLPTIMPKTEKSRDDWSEFFFLRPTNYRAHCRQENTTLEENFAENGIILFSLRISSAIFNRFYSVFKRPFSFIPSTNRLNHECYYERCAYGGYQQGREDHQCGEAHDLR
jgi:hypothetical protein